MPEQKKSKAETADWFYPLVWKSVEKQYSISADAAQARKLQTASGAEGASSGQQAGRKPKARKVRPR